MYPRFFGRVAINCRPGLLLSSLVSMVFLVGCLSTWDFQTTNKKIMIGRTDDCATLYPFDFQIDPGDILTFYNHAGDEVTLIFPEGSIVDQDEDPTSSNIEITVKKGRKRNFTVSDTPPLNDLGNGNRGFQVFVKDPCHGGANMIVEPPN